MQKMELVTLIRTVEIVWKKKTAIEKSSMKENDSFRVGE